MGRQDNWTTPKQLKIERDGEPRASRRSSLSKRNRKKGPKARMDELVSAVRELKRAKEYLAHAEVREPADSWWNRHMRESVARAQARFDEIKRNMVADGISTGNL